jgi:type I site-specific restriction endonuclease
VAVREFPPKSGYGEADYLLFVDGTPIGVVEAKKEGHTLTGVEPVYPSDKRKQSRALGVHKL